MRRNRNKTNTQRLLSDTSKAFFNMLKLSEPTCLFSSFFLAGVPGAEAAHRVFRPRSVRRLGGVPEGLDCFSQGVSASPGGSWRSAQQGKGERRAGWVALLQNRGMGSPGCFYPKEAPWSHISFVLPPASSLAPLTYAIPLPKLLLRRL